MAKEEIVEEEVEEEEVEEEEAEEETTESSEPAESEESDASPGPSEDSEWESQASRYFSFPFSVVTSQANAITFTPYEDNLVAATSISSLVLAQIVSSTPALAKASAQP